MSLKTKNHNLFKYEDNDIGDLKFINDSMDKIDKGLVLDVGISTGSGDNYILNIGEIKLDSTTKGLKLSFFADKSSSGNVTINNNYNLLNANKSPIKNLKSGVPYTVIYDGGTNFFLASGGTDEVSFTSDKLLEGYTANNSDGEKVSGSMQNNGAVTQNMSINGHITLPRGYYDSVNVNQSIATKESSTYTPGTTNQTINGNQYLTGAQTILGDGNLKAENIKKGVSIFGVNGSVTLESLGNGIKNYMMFYENKSAGKEFKLPSPPNFIILERNSSEYMYFCFMCTPFNTKEQVSNYKTNFHPVGGEHVEQEKYTRYDLKTNTLIVNANSFEMTFHCFWV